MTFRHVALLFFLARPVPAQTNQTQLASDLANRILDAQTPADRASAVSACIQAIGLGVYTPDGKPVSKGAERGLGDFFLYDFEIPLLAGLARPDLRYDYSHLIQVLELPVSARKYQSPEAFHKLVTAATQDALATPDDPRSFLLLLVRNLGLRNEVPYDLAAGMRPEYVVLTGFQEWLLLADIGIASIWGAPDVPVELYRIPTPLIRPSLVSPRQAIEEAKPKGGGFAKSGFSVGTAIGISVMLNKAMHAELISYLVQVTPLNSPYAFKGSGANFSKRASRVE